MMWRFDRFGGAVALKDEAGQTLTYAQLEKEGAPLRAAVGGRCLAFCLCRNALGSVLGYTAFVQGGIVPALLSAEIDAQLFEEL